MPEMMRIVQDRLWWGLRSMKTSNILIVDDDEDLRRLIGASLAGAARLVREAGSAMEALHAAATEPPDILLLDIGLPGNFDGFDLCQTLLREPSNHRMKVAVMSGQDDPALIDLADRLGVTSYLVKPFDLSLLRSVVSDMERGASAIRVYPASQ